MMTQEERFDELIAYLWAPRDNDDHIVCDKATDEEDCTGEIV